MGIPRNATLAEVIYRDIDTNAYLNEIYASLLYNYSLHLFDLKFDDKEIAINDALRFADLLSKSNYTENADKHKIWAQEIIILLKILYPDDAKVNHYLGSVLSAVGNYRGLKSAVKDYDSADFLDRIFYSYDMDCMAIPGKEGEYFFHDQKNVYDSLSLPYFSYSGPTSMGKSFVVQTYIKQQVLSGVKKNFAILVPTKALINEVRSNIIKELQGELQAKNYRIVTSSGDLVLKQKHNFVFVMTPERMLHLLIGITDVKIDFLFVDEAHKISLKDGRSTFYYKVIAKIVNDYKKTTVVFASPNIPNPEEYLRLIPGLKKTEIKKLASKYTPVCQFKYMIDFHEQKIFAYNDHMRSVDYIAPLPSQIKLCDIVSVVGKEKQNVIYCSSKQKVMDFAMDYAKDILPLNDEKLISLANDVKNEVHDECYLADLILKGVAYHVGYLPANIRLRIEKGFEDGIIRTIFCTSTLVEGVNLPADNLFITSHKNGPSKMNEVEFRNLIGRVGRIKYNLYGNVFLLRIDEQTNVKKYESLLNEEVPTQEISVVSELKPAQKQAIINCLANGDIEMQSIAEKETEKGYEFIRKSALILIRDIAEGNKSTVKEAFSPYLTNSLEADIKKAFPKEKTNDDITLSYDQAENLTTLIEGGCSYPNITNGHIVFEELVEFLAKLRTVFKWEVYERYTIGKLGKTEKNSVLKWYAVILRRWINGYGLSSIIDSALEYKKKHKYSGVWVGKVKMADVYNEDSREHKNYVIADTLGVIENVILFSISNYFRKFSLEYKRVHNVENFDNDWYEYVEYGTTNPLTIFLQQSGFSRETSSYIMRHRSKYIVETDGGEIKIRKNIFDCRDIGVQTEAKDIQFNVPEIFIEE